MFDGQIAVVTGAGSPAGIGYAVAEELAKHGAFVVISDLPAFEARLEGALANLRSRYPNVAMCAMDVSEAESVNAAVASIAANYGPVDILVNNAGVGGGSSEFLQLSESDFKSAFDVNFMGAVNGCRAVLPSMNERGQGAIINIASLCGLGAIPEIPVSYTASKFAVVGLTKGIAPDPTITGVRPGIGRRIIRCFSSLRVDTPFALHRFILKDRFRNIGIVKFGKLQRGPNWRLTAGGGN